MSTYTILSLSDLYYTNFILDDIAMMRQKWKTNILFQRFKPRPLTGIIFLNNCTGKYTDKSGESFFAPKKSIVCLPYGSEYTCLNLECTSSLSDAILIEFNAIENGNILSFSDKPFLLKNVNIPIAANLFENAVHAYEEALPSPLAIKTSVYNLLLHVCKEDTEIINTRFNIIRSGIELIESDIQCKLSIEEIAKACNVSPCYFRRLFKEYSGKSPLEYRIDLKINSAKKMLENNESSLQFIAESLNFESTAYFCRLFKNKVGVTPTQYKSSSGSDNSTHN